MRRVNEKARPFHQFHLVFLLFTFIIAFNKRLLRYTRNALMRLTWKGGGGGNCGAERMWIAFCVHPPLMESIEFFPVNTEHPSRNSMHP